MSMTTTESTSKEMTALLEQLESMRKLVETEQRRTYRTAWLTAAVGALLLLLASGYFLYAYNRISEATQPESIIAVAETMVDDNLPRVRQALEKEIEQSAPKWAEGLSRKAQESMPQMREKAVKALSEEAEAKLDEAAVLSEKTFREYLVKNRPMLEQKFKELATSPKLAEQSLRELELPLDDQMSGELRQRIDELVRNIDSAERNLRRLQTAKDLTPEQQVERQVWMLVRRMQMEQLSEAERISPKNPAKKPVVKRDTEAKKEGKSKATPEPKKEAPKKDAKKESKTPKAN